MELWLAVQHPLVVLLLGGCAGLSLAGAVLIVYRVALYLRYAANQRSRESACLALALVAVTAGGVGTAATVYDYLDADDRAMANDAWFEQETML